MCVNINKQYESKTVYLPSMQLSLLASFQPRSFGVCKVLDENFASSSPCSPHTVSSILQCPKMPLPLISSFWWSSGVSRHTLRGGGSGGGAACPRCLILHNTPYFTIRCDTIHLALDQQPLAQPGSCSTHPPQLGIIGPQNCWLYQEANAWL